MASKTIPHLLADKRMAKKIDPAEHRSTRSSTSSRQKTAPQFFDDLAPIPADKQL